MIITSHLLDSHAESHLIRTILLEIGIACIIAAIAEFLLLKHASEVFRQEVQEDLKILEAAVTTLQDEVRLDMKMLEDGDKAFRQEVRENTKILSHCLEHQLVDVMPSLNKEQEYQAVQEIKSAIANTRGEVRIIAFTLRDILNNRTSLDGPLLDLLDRNENVDVKLLLIDPTSNAAHIRVKAEEVPGIAFEDSILLSNLRKNFYGIQAMLKNAKSKSDFKIEARFYNILPNFYMVSTPDEVFIEPYHLGYKNGEDSTIGGVVPLLKFSSKSPMYAFAQSHFSYIWNSQTMSNQSPGSPYDNGDIVIKSMDNVDEEIERRLAERRNEASEAVAERRSRTDRRLTTSLKVRSAAASLAAPR